MERFKLLPKEKLNELPKTSGVYAFFAKNLKLKIKNLKLECIYIGKAINIQSRVKNHFQQTSYRDRLFMDKVDKIGYLQTNSEIEALILEANLIKKYQPKFNVVWRDDKNYFYVAIAQNENNVPYVFITHQPNTQHLTPNTQFVGPFVEGTALKKTLRFLRRVFPYYTQAKHPKIKCTYCHLGLCPGLDPDLAEYKNNIKKLILILKGKRSAVLNSLKKEMRDLSIKKEFEEAGKTRDRINNLQQVMSHTNIINTTKVGGTSDVPPTLNKILGINKKIYRIECYDVSNIQGKQATGSMVVFIDGAPDKNQYRKFKIKMKNEPNDIAMLKETLQRRFAHPEWPYPDVILMDGGKAQLNAALEIVKLENSLKIDNWKLKIIALAKGRQELFIEDKTDPIPLKSLPQEIYNLILQLDNEAHRFAITYHKKLRKKNLMG
jgi:excinuclease ABC subunit C